MILNFYVNKDNGHFEWRAPQVLVGDHDKSQSERSNTQGFKK